MVRVAMVKEAVYNSSGRSSVQAEFTVTHECSIAVIPFYPVINHIGRGRRLNVAHGTRGSAPHGL